MKKAALTAVLLGMISFSVASADTIDTNPFWNGTTFISSFGVTNTATYGQTITIPSTAGTLLSFSFQIDNTSATPITLRGHVYAWDGTKATGPALFNSAPVNVPADAVYHQIGFAPNIALAAGTYVLFVSTSEDQGGPTTVSRFGALTNNTTYTGGQFVFINNGPTTAQWTTTAWSVIAEDLAFTAAFTGPTGFTATPLPPTFLLVMAGLMALGLFYSDSMKRLLGRA